MMQQRSYVRAKEGPAPPCHGSKSKDRHVQVHTYLIFPWLHAWLFCVLGGV
jgi:hypothetical protein